MSKTMQKMYPRFRVMARIEHIVLLVSFTVLAITGLPQKYPSLPISQWMIEVMGGIGTIRIIHRYSAFLLVLGSVYHLYTAVYRWYVRGERMRIMLRPKDALDVWNTLLFNLGFKKEHPRMTKFNYGEKIEYWAVVWGTAIMVITGFMLWNPIAITTVLPGQFIPAAKTAHGAEALLAVLSILVWHFYNVLIKNRNWSIFTGDLPHDQMEEEHAIELDRLEAGEEAYPGLFLQTHPWRKRVYFFVGTGAAILIFIGLVWLFTFEETAVTTLPAVTREIFVPQATAVP